MTLQFIHDKGNTTGVFIPIEEWQDLKSKYSELEKEEASNFVEPGLWQKQILDKRLADYYSNKENVEDFNETLDDIERGL